MAFTDIEFETFDINDGTNYVTSQVDDTQPWTRAISMFPLAHADGASITNDDYVTKPIPVSGKIHGTSIADLEDKIDAFNAAMGVRSGNLDIGYAGGTRRWSCIAEQFSVDRPVRAAKWANFNIQFTAIALGVSTTTSALVNADVMQLSKTYSLTVPGSAPQQHLQIQIVLDTVLMVFAKSITIANPASGVSLVLTRIWNKNDIITIDTKLRECKVNGTLVDYTGNFPTLQPGAGRQLTISSDVYGSDATKFTANGTYTTPSDVTSVWVECFSGGGGGGGRTTNGGGGGGGGGAYAARVMPATPTVGYAITVGAAGTTSTGAGGSGGSSSTAFTLGGASDPSVLGGSGGSNTGAGGFGGFALGVYDIAYSGGAGGTSTSTNGGAGGGGGAFRGKSGTDGLPPVGTSGVSGVTGGGGLGRGSPEGAGGTGSAYDGLTNQPATAFAAGGGGGAYRTANNQTGGTPGAGKVFVSEPTKLTVDIDTIASYI